MMSEQSVIIGNCLEVLKGMDSNSIDVCVTSPPYWALRDYGSEPVIWGGCQDCEHDWTEHREPARGGCGDSANVGANKDGEANNRGHPTITQYCNKCGAWKGQLGLEPTPYEYIDHLIMIFNEVKRILKPSGSCWVNLGDTYSSNVGFKYSSDYITGKLHVNAKPEGNFNVSEFTEKSLCQIPSRFAIAMTDNGWILRNECIWHKPNVMPVSVKDRFTVDFEKFFFFTKEPRYYFQQQKEPISEVSLKRAEYSWKSDKANLSTEGGGGLDVPKMGTRFVSADGRNKRTVWTIPTSGSKEEHVAMYPISLIETPIKACCPEGGVVLDPFCGSGTTLEYCFEHDIDAIGIEINPKYKDIINRRSRQGQKRLGEYA